jgi:hypothetical protein
MGQDIGLNPALIRPGDTAVTPLRPSSFPRALAQIRAIEGRQRLLKGLKIGRKRGFEVHLLAARRVLKPKHTGVKSLSGEV